MYIKRKMYTFKYKILALKVFALMVLFPLKLLITMYISFLGVCFKKHT